MKPLCCAVLLLVSSLGCADTPADINYHVVNDTIPTPLVELASEHKTVASGESLFVSREAGHCVLCHQVASLDAPFQGNLGPALTNIGSRLSPGQIRYRLVDASQLNPDTIMPSYYRTDHLHQLPHQYQGKPVLDARQIEQLVIYLASLKG